MVEVTKRYFCDLCKKEIPEVKLKTKYGDDRRNPLLKLDFDLYDDEISVCEKCAKEIGERIEMLRAEITPFIGEPTERGVE